MNKKKNIIIIPTYKEEGNIGLLITEVLKVIPDTDILIIDDNSPDKTEHEVNIQTRKHGKQVKIIVRKNHRGLGSAYTRGLKYGIENNYDTIITMDADHSHSPKYLPIFLETLDKYDMVIGSRYVKNGGTVNWQIRRILLSWLANRFARFLLGLKGTDLTSGYRAYNSSILKQINFDYINSNGYSYLVEMLHSIKKLNGKVKDIPIIFFDRTMGKSKISRKEIYKGAITLLRLKLNYQFSIKKLKKK